MMFDLYIIDVWRKKFSKNMADLWHRRYKIRLHQFDRIQTRVERCRYLLCCPLEASDDTVLDLVQVLHSLGAVAHDVGSGAVGAEAPDLTRLRDVVVVLVGKVTTSLLQLLSRSHVSLHKHKIRVPKQIW